MKYSKFCFTYWPGKSEVKGWSTDYDDIENLEEILLKGKKIRHWIFGEELCPTTGKLHCQGYFETKGSYTLENVISWVKDWHVETAKGTREDNIKYCSKNGKVHTSENILTDKPGKRNDLEIAKDIIKNGGNMREVIEHTNSYQAWRGAELYFKYHSINSQGFKQKEVIWIYGPSGTGKSRSVWEACQGLEDDLWVSNINADWFDGYDQQGIVLFEDIRGDFAKFHWLLRLLDGYPMRVPIKGGFMLWNPNTIYITSSLHWREIYNFSPEDIYQLERRINQTIYMQ